jgi:hypothetical protein
MNKHLAGKAGGRWGILGSGLALSSLISGCEPINAETLHGFVVDFARQALAAWLL